MSFINTDCQKEPSQINHNLVGNIGQLIEKVRANRPLIYYITNYVTVNHCANIVLALGASPIMADDRDEVETIAANSAAVVLNIGTLNQRTIQSMLIAGKQANERGIPVILDPVGAGISTLRNKTTAQLLTQVKINVLRGNISEIGFIAGVAAGAKGADAADMDVELGIESAIATAKQVANQWGCVTAITGATDIISDGSHVICINNGHNMLRNVTGTGCMATSLTGSFCGVTSNCLLAAVSGILCMGVAGEMAFAAAGSKGPGSFCMALMDSMSKLEDEVLERTAHLYEA